MSVDEFVVSPAWLAKVSGAQRGRERHAAPTADAHGGRLAARAQPPRPLPLSRPTEAMELSDVPRHRPMAFDKMESLIKEMQDPETGVPVRSQKLFLSVIPSAFVGYDLVEWLMERFNLDETSNVEATNLAGQLCQYGYFFPVNDLKNLVLKDDSSLYRFQSPYYWPWQAPRVAGGSSAPTLGPDNVEYAIYLVKRTLRNKQRHGLEEYEQEALVNLKKNLAAKWDFITMQAEEQVRLAKDRKKGDKIVSDSQERAYWRVARPPPGVPSALEPCPVPVRARHHKPKKRTVHQLTKEIEHLKASLDRTRVKTSIALEALLAYSETFAPYDPWLTPPQPSNPWVSDDTLFWQINSPLVEVPSEKRVQRWALSIEELVSDPTGLQEFTSFLRKEYSHENIRFWLAVMDLRRSSTKHIPKKLEEIYEYVNVMSGHQFLHPILPCEFLDSPEFESSRATIDEKFKVSIVAASSCRYVYWQRSSLEYLFVKEPYLACVVTTLIARDITTKLYAMNNKIVTERGSHLDIRLPSISHALARSPRRLRSASNPPPPTTVQPVPPEKRPNCWTREADVLAMKRNCVPALEYNGGDEELMPLAAHEAPAASSDDLSIADSCPDTSSKYHSCEAVETDDELRH